MAFEKIKFAMKTWKDAVSGGTPISAAELNRIEKGISDCAKQTNELGDSVSRCARVDDMATRGAIGQRGEDVLKIGVVGESGNYVLCVRKNKALELYDRGNNRSLWTVNLS